MALGQEAVSPRCQEYWIRGACDPEVSACAFCEGLYVELHRVMRGLGPQGRRALAGLQWS